MNIAILGSRGYPSTYSGFETLVRRIAPYLVEHGHNVTVFCRNVAPDSQTGTPVEGVHRVFTRGWNSTNASTLSYGFTSFRRARHGGYDAALVVNIANGYFLPLLRRVGIPTAVNVDGLEWTRAKWSRVGKAVFRNGARATARWADRIIIDSEALRPVWGGRFPVDAIYIPYGGEVVHGIEDSSIRAIGLEPSQYVLCVARIVPENNVDLLLAASEHLSTYVPIVIVGSGPPSPLIDRLTKASRARPNIKWLGHISDQHLLKSLWAHCGAYWHGHSAGGTNPSLLQALGFGSPTLAIDTVFNREVFAVDSEQLVTADSLVLADRIDQLLNDSHLAREFSEAGQAIVGTRYQWDAVCSSYMTILDSLALNRPQQPTC